MMGKFDTEDKSYCGFDCDNKKCTRNQANIPNGADLDKLQFAYFEECKEYVVKAGKNSTRKAYPVQDLAKIYAKTESRAQEILVTPPPLEEI